MKPAILATFTLALACAAGSAGAQPVPVGPRVDTARVLHVEPLFRSRDREYVRTECWNERTGRHETGYYRDDDGRLYREDRDNKVGALVGAIIGGVIGNQVGSGSGRAAATVAGAAAGAAIGSRSNDDDYNAYSRFRGNDGIERRCRTVTTYEGRDRSRDRFRVTYSYGGQTWRTIMNHHPGRTMRVVVDVRPQDGYIDDRRR